MKTTTRASLAPGSWSVGMMRAVAASTVFHSWSVKKYRSVESGSTGSPTISHSDFSVISACPFPSGRLGEPFGPALGVGGGDVVRAAPGVGHHGEGGVHAGGGREAGTVNNEQVFDVVGLAPFVEHTLGRVRAHA